MEFDNRITEIFHIDGAKQYRLKLVYQNGKPMVGFSLFIKRGPNWFPGRKHFFFSVDAWKGLVPLISNFNERAMKGSLEDYLKRTLTF